VVCAKRFCVKSFSLKLRLSGSQFFLLSYLIDWIDCLPNFSYVALINFLVVHLCT
jgi:hypothetical protein